MKTAFVDLTRDGKNFLRKIRTQRLLSQRRIKNFNQSSISDWETGRYSPTLSNLKTYLKFLNINSSLFLSNKSFIKEIKYKFQIPDKPQKRKLKIYSTNDLRVVLTKIGKQKITNCRKRTGSQRAVSILSRIDQGTISKWEAGKNDISLKRFKNYLEIIDIEPNKFLNNRKFVKEIKESIIRKMINKSVESRTKRIIPQNELTKEKPYILGVLGPGDGWVGENQIDLTVTDKDFVKTFKRNVEQTYGIKSKIKTINPKNKNHKQLFKVRVSSKMICDDIRNYKVLFKERIWRIPSEIKRSNKNIKVAYIKGIFDSQAHVSIVKKEIRVVMLNIPGLYELKSLFNDLNISTNISEKVSKITISSRKNIENYTKLIGFNIKRKQDALKELLNSYCNKNWDFNI